jgi:hypothetical protein
MPEQAPESSEDVPSKHAILLGLAAQFPTRRGQCQRHSEFTAETFRLCLVRNLTGCQSGPSFPVGNTTEAQPLCSTGITPFLRYYGLLRLPHRQTPSYGFPGVPSANGFLCRTDADAGLPVSQCCFRCALAPITPASPTCARVRCFHAGDRLRHLRELGRWRFSVTRPNRVRLTPSPYGGNQPPRLPSDRQTARFRVFGCLLTLWRGYMWNGQFTCSVPFN